jgi:hypothetical protein
MLVHGCHDCPMANRDMFLCQHPQSTEDVREVNGITDNIFDETAPAGCILRIKIVAIELPRDTPVPVKEK